MSDKELDDLEQEIEELNDNEWNEERFQRRMDHVANASANIGSLLLKGWSMLADVCQKCHSPLMQLAPASPRCVVCDPVNEESKQKLNQNTIIRSLKTVKKQSKTDNQSNKQSNLNKIDELKELNDKLWNDNDSEFEKRMEKSQQASNKLGELLLKGWTMLSDHCNKCQTPLMSLRGGNPMCCICDSNKEKQKQKTNIQKIQKVESVKERINIPINENNKRQNDNVAPVNNNEIKRNGFDEEQKRNEDYNRRYDRMRRRDDYGYYGYGQPPLAPVSQPLEVFGFGYRQDEQLRRTMGDIVKTVLDKMNVINVRMSKSDNSLQNDINELNNLMEFLVNVQKVKSQLRR